MIISNIIPSLIKINRRGLTEWKLPGESQAILPMLREGFRNPAVEIAKINFMDVIKVLSSKM